MKVISSQRYIDQEILAEKIESLREETELELPVIDLYMQDDDGDDLYLLFDGNHTLAAAQELGIAIAFDIGDHVADWSGLAGEDLLRVAYMDSDYYDIATGIDIW